MIGWLKAIYRQYVPMLVRQSRLVESPKRVLFRLLPHDAVYDADYYASAVEGGASRSAKVMANSIRRDFAPRTIVDVGCGTGALLLAMRESGVRVLGFERSTAALDLCRRRGLEVRKLDLEKDVIEVNEKFDVAVSVEVAEHLPAAVADRYIDALTQLSDVVVFTAAPPGQGGTDHVNEQPAGYWIEKFVTRSFVCLEDVTADWQHEWEVGGASAWYFRNLMVFRRRTVPDRTPHA